MLRIAAFALALLTVACQAGASAPLGTATSAASTQRLRIALDEAPRSYDPGLQYLASEEAIGRLYTEPLLRPTADLADVEPAAAQSYSVSRDGLTYTFHLRPNAEYTDGRPVVAQDFVYAWRRLIDPRTAAPHAAFFAAAVAGGIEAESFDPKYDAAHIDAALKGLGLKALDDRTFQVTLPRPEGYFKWIATLWNGAPLRQDVAASAGWASKPETLITNGPYEVTGMGSFVILEPNPHYWGAKPRVNELVAAVADPADAAKRFQDGRLEMAGVPPSAAAQVAGDAALAGQLVKTPRLTEHWIDFNTSRAPFDNPKVRQAFAQAIDRAAYIKDAWAGEARIATGLIPEGMPGHPAKPASNDAFDAGAARGLLGASGEPASQFDGLQLLVPDQPFDKAAAGEISDQLKSNLGITVSVQPVEPVQYASRLQHGDFQLAGPVGWTADYPDPQDWFDLFRTYDGRDYPHWRNQRYDLLVQLGDETQDQTKRLQAYNQAQQVLLAELPFVPLDQVEEWVLVKPNVHGLAPSPYDAAGFAGNLAAAKISVTPA